MANEKHEVHLKAEERRKLIGIVSIGRNKAVVTQRAHMLLKVDEGKTDAEISQLLYVDFHFNRNFHRFFCRRSMSWRIIQRAQLTG